MKEKNNALREPLRKTREEREELLRLLKQFSKVRSLALIKF